MNFGQAIASGFSNYVNFSGRASRSEYWYWILFSAIAGAMTGGADSVLGMPVTNTLFSLATLLPSIAIAARRLHDSDRTAWWLLIVFTGIGAIVLIVWFCFRGTPGSNRFGADPLGAGGQLSPRPAV